MTETTPSLDLVHFVETNILPRYAEFGRSHGISHVQRVISRSLVLARRVGADLNMAYAIAAYHDIGRGGGRPSRLSQPCAAKHLWEDCGRGRPRPGARDRLPPHGAVRVGELSREVARRALGALLPTHEGEVFASGLYLAMDSRVAQRGIPEADSLYAGQ